VWGFAGWDAGWFAFCQVRAVSPRECEEAPMGIVGGLDIHRKQITFDYVDTVTGQVSCGQIARAERARLRISPTATMSRSRSRPVPAGGT
jgi:hypothetical protein